MKILKVIHGYPPTYNAGSEVYSQSICEELVQSNEVQVFTREQNDYQLDFSTRQEIRNGVLLTMVNLPREKDGYQHTAVNELFRKTLHTMQPDVVHIGHLNHLSIGIVKEAKKANVPMVFTLHDFWLMCPRGQFLQRNFDGKNIYQLCDKQENGKCATQCYKMLHSCSVNDEVTDLAYWTEWIARRMKATREIIPFIDKFIAPSKYLMNRFINDFQIPKDKITYLDYGFPTKYLQPVTPNKKRPFTFGYIGTHIPAKGVNLLIDAFKKLTAPSQLIIWGRHNGQNTVSLKKMAEGNPNPIFFEKEYDNKNIVKEVFQKIDTIVVPSIWGENSPLVIHEAQACHIPVVTADFGGMKEYVQHHVNGLLFQHRNTNDLATKMEWAIQHPDTLKQYGKRGYPYSEDGKPMDIAQHCQLLQQIYNQVI